METSNLFTKFIRMGARLKILDRPARRSPTEVGSISLDIREDRDGEYFEIVRRPGDDPEFAVLDVQSADRHLLLLVRDGDEKQKFLCGHDERHWFVAAVPERAAVGTVRQAKEALKPPEVLAAQSREGLRARACNQRKNTAYHRQGEWFFLPVPGLKVDDKLVLRDEPIRRGDRGKPHWAEFCYRTGGETVYVCRRHPNGVGAKEHLRILTANPDAKAWGWQPMRRNMAVFVRGRVRHADHQTIDLHGWHRVLMNTETQAKAMRNVAFLD
jgi:hypothetical protein